MKKKVTTHNSDLRKLAENKLLTNKKVFSVSDFNSKEAVSLVHELQVHQIELEMQNEELQSTHRALAESQEKYFNLYDFAPVGYLTLSESDQIIEANLTASKLFGIDKETLVSQLLTNFIIKEDQDIYYFHHKALFDTNELQKCELRMKGPDATIFFANITSAIFEDRTGNKLSNVIVTDITRKKKDQEHLKFYTSLFANFTDVVYTTDLQFNVTFWNSAAENVYGLKSDEVIGKSIFKVTGLNYNTKKRAKLSSTLLGKGFVRNQIKHTSKSGSIVVLDLITITNYDTDGKLTGFLGVSRDITEKTQLEENLGVQREILKAVIESSGEPIFSVDRNYCYTMFNTSHARVMKSLYGKDISIGLNILENHSNPRDRDLAKLNIDRALAGEKVTIEHFAGDNRFERNYFVITHNPIRNSEGNVTGVAIYAEDLTELKKSELRLNSAHKKLDLALENGNIGVWEWDLKTDTVILDERMEKMFGLEPESFNNTYKAFEDLINEEDISHFHKAINDSLGKDLPFETIFRTKPICGKSKYISSKALLNKGQYGKTISLTGVCFDVTSLREGTEKLVLTLNEDLLRSNKELESFAYVASHDLQEPLRMVASFTQLLEQQYKDKLDAKAIDYIHFAADGSKRMYDLLNGLLAYSRISTRGKEFLQVDLNHIVDIVLKNLSLQINERNAKVTIDELPIVFADESQMIQLFQNLIANSIKFSSDTPKIFISSTSDTTLHIISVKDDGLGIESQYFEMIFKIFQRLLPRDQFEGTGVGLAICKRIVERHRGRIWVESESGKGSTFRFTIPKIIGKFQIKSVNN